MKEPDKKIDALTENQTQRLLNFVKTDQSKDELTKTRDQAIIYVLLYT
jgi:site-specific recombinase XerD